MATDERWNALSFVSHDEVIIAQYKKKSSFLQSTYAVFEFLSFKLNSCLVQNDLQYWIENTGD